ncbi:MAG: 23S rRNA (pseudouridine(1915)-N(3))-methyltransferase RlmH, partial [Candidatus Puniceispirillaceae bacterium]
SSEELADMIGQWRADGISQCFFAIGGADGHHPDLLKEADKKIAFGRAIWPHMLCRAMLAEQLYRAEMILARHPYHRG